jgi:Fe-S-cluster containining protein
VSAPGLPMSAKKPWWADGIRFECQGSGRCCLSRDGYGFVYFDLRDRRRMAKHLGISTAAFTRRYLVKDRNGFFHLPDPTKPCRFLEGKRCSAYEGRPEQCRTWPFWPENMSARTWTKEVAVYCPGVGKGRRHTADEIRAIIASQKSPGAP